jgi:hypothetical protein
MAKTLAVSGLVIAAALLLTGCTGSNDSIPSDAPLVSEAQGLGQEKVPENLYSSSQFSQVYDSTNGAISFEELDRMDWKVQRVLKAEDGKSLPEGDNFKATSTANLSYNETVIGWVEAMKKDGWNAANEVKATPASNEKEIQGSDQDYRNKPYSVDLSKGKTTMKVAITPDNQTITLNINSQ